MAGILLTQGIRSLDSYNGTFKSWLRSLTLKLFKNNHTVAVTDGNGAFTEANFDGYSAVAWNLWSDPSLDGNNNDQFTHADVTFTMTGSVTPNTIYGYYAVDGGGTVVFAENNAAGVAMSGSGYTYTVSGNFYAGQCATPL